MDKLIFIDIETFKNEKWSNLTLQKQRAFINHNYNPDEDIYSEDSDYCEEMSKLGITKEAYDSYSCKEYEDLAQSLNYINQYNKKSGLVAEFGRVICISFGCEDLTGNFKVKCLRGDNEVEILNKFSMVLSRLNDDDGWGFSGWNINGFDKSFLIKRYIINGLPIPQMLKTYGVKPWELNDVDVMQLWKCGGYNATSLETACSCFDIPVKFTDHTGTNIWEQELNEINWDELEMYCNNDVYSSYIIYCKLRDAGYI